MIKFLLLIGASILFIIFAPIGFIWQFCDRLFHLDDYFFSLAKAVDQSGNAVASSMLNTLLIKREGYGFGNPSETISSVLGKNKATNTLRPIGRMIATILNKIDPGHCERAIQIWNRSEIK